MQALAEHQPFILMAAVASDSTFNDERRRGAERDRKLGPKLDYKSPNGFGSWLACLLDPSLCTRRGAVPALASHLVSSVLSSSAHFRTPRQRGPPWLHGRHSRRGTL